MSAAPGQYIALKVKTKKAGHKAVTRTRLYKICG